LARAIENFTMHNLLDIMQHKVVDAAKGIIGPLICCSPLLWPRVRARTTLRATADWQYPGTLPLRTS